MENEVVITYETLFEILRREKSREELQELPENFEEEVKKYLEEKKQSLFPDSDDKFSELEQEKTRKQILNIKKILNDVYERREKKIANIALSKSRIPKSVIDISRLTDKEKKLYEELLAVLNSARQDTLSNVLLENSNISGKQEQAEERQQETGPEKEETQPQEGQKASFRTAESETKTVRFKCDVSQFVGPNLEIYGPFKSEETAVLPLKVCNVLINKEKAEFEDSEE